MVKRKVMSLWEKQQLRNHNKAMIACADEIALSRKGNETKAERIFYETAKLKNLRLRREYRIYIRDRNRIVKFYFADFCDVLNKVIFEVDGGYHNSKEQKLKDALRTNDLRKMGYRVFRISNIDVFKGKTARFLIDSYESIGIDI